MRSDAKKTKYITICIYMSYVTTYAVYVPISENNSRKENGWLVSKMFKSKLEGKKQAHACLKRWFLVDAKNSLQGIRAGRQSFGNISVSSV